MFKGSLSLVCEKIFPRNRCWLSNLAQNAHPRFVTHLDLSAASHFMVAASHTHIQRVGTTEYLDMRAESVAICSGRSADDLKSKRNTKFYIFTIAGREPDQ